MCTRLSDSGGEFLASARVSFILSCHLLPPTPIRSLHTEVTAKKAQKAQKVPRGHIAWAAVLEGRTLRSLRGEGEGACAVLNSRCEERGEHPAAPELGGYT